MIERWLPQKEMHRNTIYLDCVAAVYLSDWPWVIDLEKHRIYIYILSTPYKQTINGCIIAMRWVWAREMQVVSIKLDVHSVGQMNEQLAITLTSTSAVPWQLESKRSTVEFVCLFLAYHVWSPANRVVVFKSIESPTFPAHPLSNSRIRCPGLTWTAQKFCKTVDSFQGTKNTSNHLSQLPPSA